MGTERLIRLSPRYLPGDELEAALERDSPKELKDFAFKILLEGVKGLEDLPELENSSKVPPRILADYRENAVLVFLQNPPEDPEFLDRLGRITSYHRHLGAFYFEKLNRNPEAVQRALEVGRVEALVSPLLSPEEAIDFTKRILQEASGTSRIISSYALWSDYCEIIDRLAIQKGGFDHPSPHIIRDVFSVRHAIGYPSKGNVEADVDEDGVKIDAENSNSYFVYASKIRPYHMSPYIRDVLRTEDPLKYLALNPNPEVISRAITEFGGNRNYQKFSYWLLANPTVPVEVSMELIAKASREAFFYSPLGFAQIALYAHDGDWEKAVFSTKKILRNSWKESPPFPSYDKDSLEDSLAINLLLYGYKMEDLRYIYHDVEELSDLSSFDETVSLMDDVVNEGRKIYNEAINLGAILLTRDDADATQRVLETLLERDYLNFLRMNANDPNAYLGDRVRKHESSIMSPLRQLYYAYYAIPTEHLEYLWDKAVQKGLPPEAFVGGPPDVLLRKDLPPSLVEKVYERLSLMRPKTLMPWFRNTEPLAEDWEEFHLTPASFTPKPASIAEVMYYRRDFPLDEVVRKIEAVNPKKLSDFFDLNFSLWGKAFSSDIRAYTHIVRMLDSLSRLDRHIKENHPDEDPEVAKLILIYRSVVVQGTAEEIKDYDAKAARKINLHSPLLLQENLSPEDKRDFSLKKFLSL